ncbi:MAG TPA: hypothetical protein VGR28_10540 [Candidatus Thermoplasmatota archaeon]|jgi:hypothetical protein|nr:hypothetical protein [Candidatus Thermoplasmatota archaeon]
MLSRFRAPAVALLALLTLPASPALAAADGGPAATNCFEDVDLLICVTATMTLDLNCAAAPDAAHAICHAVFTWTTEGHSTLMLPGSAQHAASALLEWCRPDAFCQGYGVGFLIESCSFGPLAPSCTDTGTFDLYPGPIPLQPGQCMPTTLSGFARADGFLVNPQLLFGQPLATATVTDEVSTTFCL